MDEDIAIISTNTRNEKIKNFFINNRKILIIIVSIIIITIIGYLSLKEVNKRNNIKIANQYNSIVLKFNKENKDESVNQLTKIINKKNAAYSPLALYFIIDNDLISERESVNELFDIIIKKTNIDTEIKNLIIYKKALFNAESSNENELIKILNPLINSNSVWKSHALHLLGEFFFSKNQKNKSKEFFQKILILENSNSNIRLETQKRLNRDFSE
jgi:predicted negative regulator of RcsB-dependent stress response